MVETKKPVDLETRTTNFSKEVLLFIKTLPFNELTKSILAQLIRSVTSIGANYMEADGAESKKDFRHSISRCKKEAKESRYWFHMLAVVLPEHSAKLREFWKESEELIRIFGAILSK